MDGEGSKDWHKGQPEQMGAVVAVVQASSGKGKGGDKECEGYQANDDQKGEVAGNDAVVVGDGWATVAVTAGGDDVHRFDVADVEDHRDALAEGGK